ncbi:MAG: outer membrane beta-barrel protein [Bacteroidetes bacterium]|nr:outer membrane beta-barrel protein [Bacteroidota bacterium]
MKIITTICLLLSTFTGVLAQNKISGKVENEKNDPLPSATIVLLNPADSTLEYFGVANKQGIYTIRNIDDGNYLLQFAFVGMESHYQKVLFPRSNGEDMGTTTLNAKPLDVEEVTVVAEYVPMKFDSDTIEFNARVVNTKPDAVVEQLLQKLPGIEIDRAGNIKAMGESVVKVLVDGKEFFGNDLKIATKNLPADAIEKVKIFDRRSDVSQFTGIDDGVRDRTIDLQLKEDKKKGIFGNVEAGYGTENHYLFSGRAFRFNKVSQIAILGHQNNINRFGLKGQEFGQSANGLNTNGSAGVNLSYNPSDFNRYYMSYTASGSRSILDQKTETQNFLQDLEYFQDNLLDQTSRDTSHNFHFGVRTRFLGWQNLVANANINIAERNVIRTTIMNRLRDNNPINQLISSRFEEGNSVNFNGNGSHIVKINEDKTQFTTKFGGQGSRSFSGSEWNNITSYYSPNNSLNTNEFQDNHNEQINLRIIPALVQKLNRFWYFNTHVALGLNKHHLDRNQGLIESSEISTDSLSPDYHRDYRFIRPGLSLQRNTEKNQLSLSIGAEWSDLNQILWDETIGKQQYFYLKPRINYNSQYKAGRRFEVSYSTGLQLPGIHQLMPVVSTLNPLSLYQGNSSLEPEYQHNAGVEWRVFDEFSFTSFFARLSANYTENKIGMARTISENLEQYATPVNVAWGYGGNGSFNFSTPIRPLDIEISLDANERFNRGINVINDQENIGTYLTHSLRFEVNNRNKNVWDVEMGASVSMTDSWFSIQENLNNRYFNFNYFGSLRWTPADRFNMQVDADVRNYNARSFDEAISIPLIGAEANVYFLSGNRLVVSLIAADILNKNTGLKRISDVNYLMQQTSNVLGRYFMVSVKYRFNQMGRLGKGGK